MAADPVLVRVRLYSSSTSRVTEGVTRVRVLSGREAFLRGGRISAKVVFGVVALFIPFVIIEPFFAMIWGSVVFGAIFLIVGPIVHLRFSQERRIFDQVDASCPNCGKSEVLNSYVSAEFKDSFTVLCPSCGQTCSADRVIEESAAP